MTRTVRHHRGGYDEPEKQFAIGLGCDLKNADKLVYSKGLTIDDPGARAQIGAGCKLCERRDCTQRAFPPLSTDIKTSDDVTSFSPYAVNN